MQTLRLLFRYSPVTIIVLAAALMLAPRSASAEALLLVEADSGKVLEAQNATYPWYPASVTKLMTAYVTLKAVKDGKASLDTLLTVSPTAASQSPSKMGYRPGTQVTIDNALKMMLVKSANDMAVVLAEGIGGSIDGFSIMMNETAQKLGMTQTSYVNPNGLPADGQITSARDLAILARSIIRDLPEYEYFVHIPSIRYGRRVVQNFNRLIGRYPGADGFKTGFICASGYNLVASATRNGKRLIAVVLGASSGQMRAVRAIQMLDRGFNPNQLGWLKAPLGNVEQLVPVDATPPNLRDDMCNGRRHRPASDDDEDTVASGEGEATGGTLLAGLQTPTMKPSELLAAAPTPSEPILVYTGPTRTGAALIAAVAADADAQTPPRHRGKKAHANAKKDAKPAIRTAAKGEGDAKAGSKTDAKPSEAKPAAAGHTAARHDAGAKSAEKPVSDAAAKPGKPKAAAKPKGDGKPAPKNG
ncbi:penicillin-binding protein [Bradyrhizobium sp. SSBR45G]|uniref:serine hydrolase n=1 Tax=unclassified Bradyrhizobium TaxID=2631580 RepID=UPI002342AE1D|nr:MULTISPECIES: serine hydrolase [unclassified Bradyrhizobium]GLH79218.1 penicillin-binding protein [Bradyrhizobium sp. SSBR45G]GLH84653.1 penicillin-binding protein [Bradyrhizobium sp. SSBR45R]